jgi:hypothetical protein
MVAFRCTYAPSNFSGSTLRMKLAFCSLLLLLSVSTTQAQNVFVGLHIDSARTRWLSREGIVELASDGPTKFAFSGVPFGGYRGIAAVSTFKPYDLIETLTWWYDDSVGSIYPDRAELSEVITGVKNSLVSGKGQPLLSYVEEGTQHDIWAGDGIVTVLQIDRDQINLTFWLRESFMQRYHLTEESLKEFLAGDAE